MTHLLPLPLNVKVEQFGPLVSVILSFSDVYLPILQIKILVIIFISYNNSGFVNS
jgi:hypothetical protein